MINPTRVRVEDAAMILGVDTQTLRLCMQQGYYKDIGEAVKSNRLNECYSYDISKYKLYRRQGLDIRVSIEETIKLIKSGSPPYIQPELDIMLDQYEEWLKEKDTLADQSNRVSNVEPL